MLRALKKVSDGKKVSGEKKKGGARKKWAADKIKIKKKREETLVSYEKGAKK